MASPKPTFLSTVTLTCILLDGSQDPSKNYAQHQLWYADVVGWNDEEIESVQSDEFHTSIKFWERNQDYLPVRDCAAIIVGDAFFVQHQLGDKGALKPSLSLHINATQVSV